MAAMDALKNHNFIIRNFSRLKRFPVHMYLYRCPSLLAVRSGAYCYGVSRSSPSLVVIQHDARNWLSL